MVLQNMRKSGWQQGLHTDLLHSDLFVSLALSNWRTLWVKAIEQIWNIAPSSSLGQSIILLYLTMLHGKIIRLVGYHISCEWKTGETFKPGLWGNMGSWEQGNVALFSVGVLCFCGCLDELWSCGLGSCVGCSPPPNILYCYSTPKTTKYVSLKFLENWPLFLMI